MGLQDTLSQIQLKEIETHRKISNTQSKHGLDRASQVKHDRNKTTNNKNKNKKILTMVDN